MAVFLKFIIFFRKFQKRYLQFKIEKSLIPNVSPFFRFLLNLDGKTAFFDFRFKPTMSLQSPVE